MNLNNKMSDGDGEYGVASGTIVWTVRTEVLLNK